MESGCLYLAALESNSGGHWNVKVCFSQEEDNSEKRNDIC